MLSFCAFWLFGLCSLNSNLAATDPVPPPASQDPLFSLMAGTWEGEGERFFPLAGKRIRLVTTTRAWQEGDRLLSRNQVCELTDDPPEPGVDRTTCYVRLYWVHVILGKPGEYELGQGSGETGHVTAVGHLAGLSFEVIEKFGGEPPFWVHTKTDFDGSGLSLMVQTGWQGETKTSETTVRYRRKP